MPARSGSGFADAGHQRRGERHQVPGSHEHDKRSGDVRVAVSGQTCGIYSLRWTLEAVAQACRLPRQKRRNAPDGHDPFLRLKAALDAVCHEDEETLPPVLFNSHQYE